ncbi:MAG: hypothetical protein ACKVYV_04685 [Limisphaerales bacterium]
MKRIWSRPLAFVLLGSLALAVVYVAVERRLAARLAEQEGPLADLRRRLALAAGEAGLTNHVSPERLAARLAGLRAAGEEIAAAAVVAQARLALPASLRERVEAPFQLVDFQNETERRLEDLGRTAGEAKVALGAGVAGGFPRHSPDFVRPELQWAQLELVSRLVRAAVAAQVVAIHDVGVPDTPGRPLDGSPGWDEVRAFMAFTGPADAAMKLLAALTLIPAEADAAGFPSGLAGQPALLLDHLLVRRTALERPDEVNVELVVSLVVPTGAVPP